MHAKDALRLKLVDSVSTFEEFADVNFPNSPIEDYTYRIEGMRFGNIPSKKEIKVITNFFEILAMPQVALFSSNDPLLESMAELFSLLDSRLQSGLDLDSLDFWLESFFTSMKGE